MLELQARRIISDLDSLLKEPYSLVEKDYKKVLDGICNYFNEAILFSFTNEAALLKALNKLKELRKIYALNRACDKGNNIINDIIH